MQMYKPSHPGKIIRASMGEVLTVSALAKHLGVTRAHLSMILNGRAGVSALMALKLDEAFENSEGFWWRLQSAYELAQARRIKRPKVKSLKKLVFSSAVSIPHKNTMRAQPAHKAPARDEKKLAKAA